MTFVKRSRFRSTISNAALGLTAAALSLHISASLAEAIPTHGAVTHFDLNVLQPGFDVLPAFPGVPPVPIPAVGGPCVSFATGEQCRFVDALFSPSLWHWETEIQNVNPFPVTFTVGFFFPNGGGPIAGTLALAPLATFAIDIHVQDRPPELGPWFWSGFSSLAFPIGIDTSVTEDFVRGPENPGDFEIGGDGSFDPGPVDPAFRFELQVPEPSTLVLFGLGIFGLVGYNRRRRRQPGAKTTDD